MTIDPAKSPTSNTLLQAAGNGDRAALDEVWPDLYEHLHEMAARRMANERSGLLQTTAIVHEAYLRLSNQNQSNWPDRPSFFAAAAVVMRRILIDSARREKATKRGGKVSRQPLSDTQLAVDDSRFSALDIHEALEKLSEFAADQAQALELMIFGGLSGDEVAKVMQVSPSTVDRRVRAAKAWLRRELGCA